MSIETGQLIVSEVEAYANERTRIAMLAGGGGGAAIGPDLIEHFPDSDITIITGIGDGGGYEEPNGGGATREVRAVFGGGAPGDLRHIIAAVSGNQAGKILDQRYAPGEGLDAFYETSSSFITALEERNTELAAVGSAKSHDVESIAQTVEHANQLAEYLMRRTGRADLEKHTWGNILITALRLENDRDIAAAAATLNDWMETKAKVIPSTTVVHDLIMDDGGTIKIGEGDIDLYIPKNPKEAILELEAEDPHSEVEIFWEADEDISNADTVIMAPGSTYTTQDAMLSIKGMPEAFARQRYVRGKLGQFVLLANIAQEDATVGLSLGDQGNRLAKKAGREFDLTVYNENTSSLPDGKVPLRVTEKDLSGQYAKRVIGAMLLADREAEFSESDEVARQGRRATTFHDVAVAVEVMRANGAVPLASTADRQPALVG